MFRPIVKAALSLTAALTLAACGNGEGAQPGEAAGPGGAMPAPAVTVARPLVQRVVDWDAFSGRFEAPQTVNVRARVSGYLDAVHFEDGAMVEEGQPLFTIDPRPYQAAVQAARGQVEQARAQVEQTEQALARAKELAAAQAVSEQSLEDARAAYQQAQAALSAARANLNAAELDLQFTQVAAPISGRVSDRRVDRGNLVSSQDLLTTIVSVDPIHFAFDVSEAALLNYQRNNLTLEGAAADIRLQGESDYRWEGEVTFADNMIDPSTGTLRARAEVPNPAGFLRPGMYGDARVQGSAPYEAILVPQTAVMADATRRIVYVVGEDGAAQARPVELGPLSGDLRVVKSGLEPDDRVVIDGLQRIARPGMPVDPQPGEIARREAPAATASEVTADGPQAAAALPVE